MSEGKNKVSITRKMYIAKLALRCVLFLCLACLFIFRKEEFSILVGWKFFERFSILHVMWVIWLVDMVMQLMPVRAYISIGSQKVFLKLFRPKAGKVDRKKLKEYIVNTTKSAYKVMILWVLVNAVVYTLYFLKVIEVPTMFMITTFYYVADLICVVIWCPFRLIMQNKCCTTCRIFNWDHLMMFTPFLVIPGFYTWVLAGLAILIWIVWEICVFTYPERFWENSNMALKCSECTDKLCTQYCRRLRKK